MLALARHITDTLLGQPRQTEAGTPVGHLANRDRVDTLINTSNTLLAVDVGEHGEGARGLDAGRCLLVARDLDRLHACAETHGSVRLRDTTENTSGDTSEEGSGTERAGIVPALRAPSQSLFPERYDVDRRIAYSPSEDTNNNTAPLVEASIQACHFQKSGVSFSSLNRCRLRLGNNEPRESILGRLAPAQNNVSM